jgi:hypothetical protein
MYRSKCFTGKVTPYGMLLQHPATPAATWTPPRRPLVTLRQIPPGS